MSMKYNSTMRKGIKIMAALLVSGFILFSGYDAKAQSVSHSKSGITTTVSNYSWWYQITSNTGKNIEYFLVQDSNGNIKAAFNACDVCYNAHLGYSQVGMNMKCNNCGNQYAISDLGSAGTGGCWPGHLPHSEGSTEIFINHSDLETGAYYFLLLTGINENANGSGLFSIEQDINALKVNLPEKSESKIKIFDITGKEKVSCVHNTSGFSINTQLLKQGIYILCIEQNGKPYTEKFVVK